MSYQISNLSDRMNYQNAVQIFERAGFDISRLKLTMSTLRLEVPLTAGTNSFLFPVLEGQNNASGIVFNTEKRLKLQDSFLATSIFYGVALPASSADATFLPKTFVNPQVFTNVNNTIYNGMLEITVNKDIKLTGWDLLRHYYAPQTQDSGQATPPVDEFDASSYASYPCEPNVIMVGSRDNVVKAELAAPLASTDTNARLILIFRGLLAQNSTPVR